jgi:hypothetical protein
MTAPPAKPGQEGPLASPGPPGYLVRRRHYPPPAWAFAFSVTGREHGDRFIFGVYRQLEVRGPTHALEPTPTASARASLPLPGAAEAQRSASIENG